MTSASEVTIRQITDIDNLNDVADLVAEVLNSDFPYKSTTITQYRDEIFTLAYFQKEFASESEIFFGAYADNRLVGFISFRPEFGGVIYANWLAVKSTHRKQGIGSRLLKKMDEWALKNNYHYLFLYTETQRNIAFYESQGFKNTGIHEGAWFGETEHIMSKRLTV